MPSDNEIPKQPENLENALFSFMEEMRIRTENNAKEMTDLKKVVFSGMDMMKKKEELSSHYITKLVEGFESLKGSIEKAENEGITNKELKDELDKMSKVIQSKPVGMEITNESLDKIYKKIVPDIESSLEKVHNSLIESHSSIIKIGNSNILGLAELVRKGVKQLGGATIDSEKAIIDNIGIVHGETKKLVKKSTRKSNSRDRL